MNKRHTQVHQTLELLCREFPKCFVLYEIRRRPLKVGILNDILARLGDRIDREQLGLALRVYVVNRHYRKSQQPGAPRIDLDGNESGVVSEAEGARAAADVAKHTKAAAAIRKQTAVRQPDPVLTPEMVVKPAPPSKRLGLSDLRQAARQRRLN